jgi:hypothetical protein
MTNREIALEQALGAVVTVAYQLGINVTLLDKAKAELLGQDDTEGSQGKLLADAVHEIELAASTRLSI